MIRLFVLAGLFTSLFASVFVLPSDQGKTSATQPPQDKVEVELDDENAIARRDFMRTKLMYVKNVFEGLTTGDFKLIDEGIKEVERVTEGEKWVEINNAEYRRLTEEFKTSVKRLKAASKSKNIEATALRYYQMSTSCIDCHQHIRKAQYRL